MAVTPLYFLTGPTASGKTDLAHRLADRLGLRLLSADSMMVYRGMDIGTAKPTPSEIREYDYAGLNLTDPGTRFSAGDWLRAVRRTLDERPTLMVGGTGLYYNVLIRGLSPEEDLPEVDDGRPVPDLQAEIRSLDPSVLQRLSDPENPRRLARALAWLRAGKPLPDQWTQTREELRIPVLVRPVDQLDARIRLRAEAMFADGLLDEAAALREHFGEGLGTAAQAIGYREAFAVLDGALPLGEAIAAVSLRTRKYAKRQRTWFRNQMRAVPVEADRDDAVDFIEKVWQEQGPFCFNPGHE